MPQNTIQVQRGMSVCAFIERDGSEWAGDRGAQRRLEKAKAGLIDSEDAQLF
jgi:hypothetical protein